MRLRTSFKLMSDFLFYLGGFVLLVGCSNVFSLQGYLILFGGLILFGSLIFDWNVTISKNLLVTASFGIFYTLFFSLFSAGFSLNLIARKLVYTTILPVIISLVLSRDGFNFKRTLYLLSCFVIGLAFQGILLFLSSYLCLGLDFRGTNLISFWESESISRTGLQMMLFPLVGVSFAYLLAFNRYKKAVLYYFVCLALVVFDLFVLLAGLTVGNRAIYVAFFLQLLLTLLILVLRIRSNKARTWIVGIAVLGFLIVLGFFLGIIPVPEFLKNIPLIGRFLSGGSDAVRVKLYIGFFQNFWRFPLGGLGPTLQEIDAPYVHNFILDIYTYGGIFPFAIFIYLFSRYLIDLFTIKRYNFSITLFLSLLFSSIFFLGLFEPLFQANEIYFVIVFLIFSETSVLAHQPKQNLCFERKVVIQ